jgi:hypothetical protein
MASKGECNFTARFKTLSSQLLRTIRAALKESQNFDLVVAIKLYHACLHSLSDPCLRTALLTIFGRSAAHKICSILTISSQTKHSDAVQTKFALVAGPLNKYKLLSHCCPAEHFTAATRQGPVPHNIAL